MISKKVELKLKRIKLIQSGQEEAAQQVLREYWTLNSQDKETVVEKQVVQKVIQKKELVKDVIKEEYKFNSIDELVGIKGIGKETAKDIKKIYKTMSKLIKALRSGENLPLRNDIAKKLKKELK